MNTISKFSTTFIFLLIISSVSSAAKAHQKQQEQRARQILDDAGIKGGLIVHIGCGDGRLTAALCTKDSYLVHGLDSNKNNVEKARQYIKSLKIYGKVSVDQLKGTHLPYIDNLINLVVSEQIDNIPMNEVMRVLAPNGVAYIKNGDAWTKTIKPWPKEIDEWTHYLYDASGNAVSHDSIVGPPNCLQWISGPKWSRHHDRMASMSALVSAGGRIFYIIDEGSTASIQLPPRWVLIARDAFNGVVLWKRPISSWHTHLWPFKSGPAQLPRRLVAIGDEIYVTLGLDAPLIALDAATGKTIRIYKGTKATEEIIASDGVLFLLVNETPTKRKHYQPLHRNITDAWYRAATEWPWDEQDRTLMAIQAKTGEVIWSKQQQVVPLTLAVDQQHLYFHDGDKVVCLNCRTAEQLWLSSSVARRTPTPTLFGPTLVVYGDVVLFSGGTKSLTAFSAQTGMTLWTSEHPETGHACPQDVLIVDGLVWAGAIANQRDSGVFTGRDLFTGEIKSEFAPDIKTHWFHHRCYRSKATDKYILPSRTGIEFIDFRNKHWIQHHWVRGGCLYGFMPCNGLIYTPPHSCACYLEAKLNGFCALAAKPTASHKQMDVSDDNGLEKGPAYTESMEGPLASPRQDDWPTYRHDAARSGYTKNFVPINLETVWKRDLGDKLSSIVIAEGKVFVASVDTHTIYALDECSGKILWSYMVGGRVDSPPTIYQDRVLFGSADGWVYCLRACDGKLIWRFRAAPVDHKLLAFGHLESVWPVHGSVLVLDDIVYFVAGRSMFLDGGLRLCRLDLKTGHKLTESILNESNPETGNNLQEKIHYLNMPTALPDILSSDGRYIYMRSQRFDLQGNRQQFTDYTDVTQQKGEDAHLFCPTGFLENSWFHRSYWIFGKSFLSGAGGWYCAGQFAPAGRLLVFDDNYVCGYGRKWQYYRWTTPLEYHLFATDKKPEILNLSPEESEKKKRRGSAQNLPTNRPTYNWSQEIPLHVQAMVLANKTLFIAGPPDLIDEEEAFNRHGNADLQAKLKEQSDAFEGRKGALLWAISASEGKRLAEYNLESPPVWDGMAAANGRLYLSMKNGQVLSLDKK